MNPNHPYTMAFNFTLNFQCSTVWQIEQGESETQRRKHQEQTQIVVIKGLDAITVRPIFKV